MKIEIEISRQEVIRIIKEELENKLNHKIKDSNFSILVKNTENYTVPEWKNTDIKVVYKETE
jgi:hypothetical protein